MNSYEFSVWFFVPIPNPKFQHLQSILDLIHGDASDIYTGLLGDSNVETTFKVFQVVKVELQILKMN